MQFLFIHQIENLSNMPDINDTLSSELYSDPAAIQENLLWHAQSLIRKSEDIQILGVRYLLELIELKDGTGVRATLVKENVLKGIYQAVIELKHDDCTERNVELSVLCAKVIAAIGLPHLFLNHAQLEATN